MPDGVGVGVGAGVGAGVCPGAGVGVGIILGVGFKIMGFLVGTGFGELETIDIFGF
jgi:hypothetical protein